MMLCSQRLLSADFLSSLNIIPTTSIYLSSVINHVVQYERACVYYVLLQTRTLHVVRHTSNASHLHLTAEAGFESRDWAGSEACISSSIACVDLITKEGLGVWLLVGTRDSSLIGTGIQDAATLWFARREAANEHDTDHL